MYCCISYYVVLYTILYGIIYCCIWYCLLYCMVLFTVLILYTLASLTRFTPWKTFTQIPVIQPFSFNSQLKYTTLRCLSVDNSLLSVDNPNYSSTSQASNTVILNWLSMQKSYSRIFLRGHRGGGGQKWLQESAVTKFKIENTLGVDSYHSVDTHLPFSRHIATI